MAYTVLEQVKIRLKQFHIDDSSGTDIAVFDHKEENPLLEQLIAQATDEVMNRGCTRRVIQMSKSKMT